jgi:hypothetical protein
MACVSEFNTTLFELTDEMVNTIHPSAIMMTAYSVFKQTLAADPQNEVALDAFWEIAKDQADMIQRKDVGAMADLLRTLIPMPGMVDDVLSKLSDENRGIVGDYIAVLYDQASALKNRNHGDAGSGEARAEAGAEAGAETPAAAAKEKQKQESNATMYSMYNDVWKEFLLLLVNLVADDDAAKPLLQQGLDKMVYVLGEKGASTSMVYAVVAPVLEPVLPEGLDEDADILKLCMPPSRPLDPLKSDIAKLGEAPFPFYRAMPFSTMLAVLRQGRGGDRDARERLATYWHYIKLLTLCLKECPPEVAGMMNQMAALFRHDASEGARFLREQAAVLIK